MARRTARDIRSESRFEVLHALFALGPSTRMELARESGLSLATVSTLTSELISEGVVRVAETVSTGVGRPHARLSIDPDRGRLVGVDVAETYVEATVFDLALGALATRSVALDEHVHAPGYVVEGIADAVEQALAAAGVGRDAVIGVGVSLPGQVQPEAGVSVFAPHWSWHDVGIHDLLTERLRLPVRVDNPLKAIAIAELWFGVGRVSRSIAVVNLGTGVGAGLAIGGAIVRGPSNNAGEWGHTMLVLDGRGCRCGRQGCVEAYVGAEGMVQTLAEIDPDHPAVAEHMQSDFVAAVAEGLRRDDPALQQLVERTAHYLAAALGDLVNMVNPEHITLTGWTVWQLGRWLVPATQERLEAQALPGSYRVVTLASSQVEGNMVALGMATFALEAFLLERGLPSRVDVGRG